MNSGLADGLASAGITRPVFSFSFKTKVFASTTLQLSDRLMSFWPIESRAPQRLIDAMQSSAVTGAPSCHSRPSRSVKV